MPINSGRSHFLLAALALGTLAAAGFSEALEPKAAAVNDEHGQQQPQDVAAVVGKADKKFYSWGENSKRASHNADDENDMEKRGGKFYAWHGKRSEDGGRSAEEEASDEHEMSKRKFYQWAGKRADNYKRRFYAWAGKRSAPGEHEDEQQANDVEKRKFYAWAGKRSEHDAKDDDTNDLTVLKRKFYAWAGKRADSSAEQQQTAEKRKFYAWAGRR